MIYLIGLTIACFLFILILLKKEKRSPDYVLLAWICLMIVHLSLFYTLYSGILYRYPHVLGFMLPLPILHGVFLYFYAKELTGSSVLKIETIFLHLLPFLLLIVLAFPFFMLPPHEKVEVFQAKGKGFEWYTTTKMILILVSGFAYSFATILELKKYRKRLLSNFSNSDKRMLRWLEYLTIGLGGIWLLTAFFGDNIIFAGVVVFVVFIGFFGINQVPVFYSNLSVTSFGDGTLNETDQNRDSTIQEKYAKTGLKDEETPEIMERLEELMKAEKPFKKSDLTLADLANFLGIPANQLSQVINSISGKTFYHYINSYRIKEFLHMSTLPENRKFTFLALAYDCGFNSKTTFNKYFKLHTGKTPSEYLEPTLMK